MIKLFCKHDWKTHIKKTYTWKEMKIVCGTEYWFNPKVQEIRYEKNIEILICKKCGKLEKIIY